MQDLRDSARPETIPAKMAEVLKQKDDLIKQLFAMISQLE